MCEKFNKVLINGIKGTIKVVGRRAVYSFRQNTLQKLDEDISEIRNNLLLALDVLQFKDYQKIQDDVTEFKLFFEFVRTIDDPRLV